ncbi:hypothetical protein ACRB68_69840 [Actinomadura sp. RB68]|uniref:TY-Chap N-terminal domain-containing protein n=2 Tax=Actinomadura macrotermitis TaxID=2585200 RepID=A0A7K0C611_9ACTN|nr:hypothetical protein [Actinomadura macrotermitis]
MFAAALARCLRDLPVGGVVIIEEAGFRSAGKGFTQFRRYPDYLTAEVPGDPGPPPSPGARVGAAITQMLTESGWQQQDPDRGGNRWFELSWPATTSDYQQLATMIVTALRDAFRIPSPDALRYHAWNEGDGNRQLDLSLGIPTR